MTCQARQYSDQMMCPKCNLAWDVNDPEPPKCPRSVENLAATRTGTFPARCMAVESTPGGGYDRFKQFQGAMKR